MPVDQKLNRLILEAADAVHPEELHPYKVAECYWSLYPRSSEDYGDEQDVMYITALAKRLRPLWSAIRYLADLELVESCEYNCMPAPSVTITAKGQDLLESDGGTSAILNTVTVKFDTNNMRELVEAGLLMTDVPKEKQNALKKAIREAPGTVLQTAITKIVEKGMSHPVETAKVVSTLFGIKW